MGIRLDATQTSSPVVLHVGGLHSFLVRLTCFLRLPWTSGLHVAGSSLRLQPYLVNQLWLSWPCCFSHCPALGETILLFIPAAVPCLWSVYPVGPLAGLSSLLAVLAFVASATPVSLVMSRCLAPTPNLALKMPPGGGNIFSITDHVETISTLALKEPHSEISQFQFTAGQPNTSGGWGMGIAQW